ncbi:MAG TPA: cob(I)yrinic acid a,c-diamide adenosyltransferase [Gammaproteobacteria bacterium]|nr:cob(I)yrinic acid a,c-diamide adenosyltransferase [Gammaproteobacteria bacterium]
MSRLTRIVTRTGDSGTTALADGSRMSKSALRIVAMGEVDELNSQLGLLAAEATLLPEIARLEDIQHALFDLGGELAMPGVQLLTREDVLGLEADISAWNAALPILDEFILPAGSRAVAQTHVARAVCRRAERALAAIMLQEPLANFSLPFANRLSDWLFVLARRVGVREGGTVRYWSRTRRERVAGGATGAEPKQDG